MKTSYTYSNAEIKDFRKQIQWHKQAIEDLSRTEYKKIWGKTAESHQKII